MKRPINHCSQHNQELVDWYEKLRAEALDIKMSSSRPPGFSILLFRGMASWIETCLSSEFQITPRPSSATKDRQSLTLPPQSIHKELAMILTNMVFSHQKEQRNNYA